MGVCKMEWRRAASLALVWPALLAVTASAVRGQDHAHSQPVRLGVTATGIWTYVDPAIAGESLSEGYLTQPVLMAHGELWGGRISVMATLNFEGLTLQRGELATGNAGEGYVDRRHPHTYLHEAMLVARLPDVAGFRTSLAMGRGFAPFGTDDPMMRPFTKYPGNHHLAQILERWVAIAAVRRGPFMVETGLFNGDEPVGPDDLGRAERFGDSWAVRTTLLPARWLELQGSHASVVSPEHALGGGLDHRKWSASARFEGATHRLEWYGLAEWGRTDEYNFGLRAFTFETQLAEVAAARDGWRGALRLERTTRPEEERVGDAFRSVRPHAAENILAITRWTSVGARMHREIRQRTWSMEPFVELSRHAVERRIGVVFDPIEHYGNSRIWNLSLGARIGIGAPHARMGRYGFAVPTPPSPHREAASKRSTP